MTDRPIEYPITAVQTFAESAAKKQFLFTVAVPDYGTDVNRLALVSVHGMLNSGNIGEFNMTAKLGGADLTPAVVNGGATTNRYHKGGLFYLPVPPMGDKVIEINTTRAISSLVVVFCLVGGVSPAAPVRAYSAVGPDASLTLDAELTGGLTFVSGQARRGNSQISPTNDLQEVLAHVSPNTEDNGYELTAALSAVVAAEAGAATVGMTGTNGGITVLLAAEFARSEDDDGPGPTPSPAELIVTIRDIQPGGRLDMRHVKPLDIVLKEDGTIDWDKTPYSGITVSNAGPGPLPG